MLDMAGKEQAAVQINPEQEVSPNTPKRYKWLSKEQYYANLEKVSEADRGKAVIVKRVVTSIFSPEFSRNKAALFAVGSAAIPPELLGSEPHDLDFRLVFSKDKNPNNAHELYLLQKRLETSYNSAGYKNAKAILGELRFSSDYNDDAELFSADFDSGRGKSVNLFLPWEYSYNMSGPIRTYMTRHRDHLAQMHHEMDRIANGEREDDYWVKDEMKKAFIVKLTP